jgi:hypothetical protein
MGLDVGRQRVEGFAYSTGNKSGRKSQVIADEEQV